MEVVSWVVVLLCLYGFTIPTAISLAIAEAALGRCALCCMQTSASFLGNLVVEVRVRLKILLGAAGVAPFNSLQ